MIKYYTFVDKVGYALHQLANVRPLMTTAIVAVISVVICAVIWLPISSEKDSIEEQIGRLSQDIHHSIKLTETARLYKSAAKKVELIDKRLNADTGQAVLIDNLHRLAKRYRVSIKDEAYEEGKGKESYQPLNQMIVVEGSYTALCNFLHAIDGLPTWTVVIESQLTLHRSQPGTVVANLHLATYRKT